MKGPFERLKYDLRRIWECPQCGHKVRTDGSVTTQFCRCGKSNTNPAIPMKLVGDGPRRLVPPVPRPAAEVAVPQAIAASTQVVAASTQVVAVSDVVATQVEVVAVTTEKIVEVTTTEIKPTASKGAGPET